MLRKRLPGLHSEIGERGGGARKFFILNMAAGFPMK